MLWSAKLDNFGKIICDCRKESILVIDSNVSKSSKIDKKDQYRWESTKNRLRFTKLDQNGTNGYAFWWTILFIIEQLLKKI